MKILIRDPRITSLGTEDFLKVLQGWCNEAYRAKAQDQNLSVKLQRAEVVGPFFSEDLIEKAEVWNAEISAYCQRMFDYLNTDILAAEDFWDELSRHEDKKKALLRLARMGTGLWDDTAKYLKLGFDSDTAYLSPSELDTLRHAPQEFAIVEGQLNIPSL